VIGVVLTVVDGLVLADVVGVEDPVLVGVVDRVVDGVVSGEVVIVCDAVDVCVELGVVSKCWAL